MIHEVEDGLKVRILDPLEVEQRMLVLVPPENVAEEGRACGQDDLVCGHLLVILARKRHVEKVLIVPDLSERRTDVALEIVPFQTELFT